MTLERDAAASGSALSTRRRIGAIAEFISGGLIVILAIGASFGPDGLAAYWWAIAWGTLGLLSAIGLYRQIRDAVATSFVFSLLTAFLVLFGLALGGAEPGNQAWMVIAFGLISLSSFVALYGLGVLGRILGWIFS
jgi:hypothetical protein